MKSSPFLVVLAFVFLLGFVAEARAELNLAEYCPARVSSVSAFGNILSDQDRGAASLHDGDLNTVWVPPVGSETWVEFDLSLSGKQVEVVLESVKIIWSDKVGKELELWAGPDRYSLSMLKKMDIGTSDELLIDVSELKKSARYLRLEFSPGNFEIAEIEIHADASGAQALIPPDASLELSGKVLKLAWDRVSDAWMYEVMRTVAGEQQDVYYTTAATSMLENPADLANTNYRVRSIACDGSASEWSSPVVPDSEMLSAWSYDVPQVPRLRGVVEGYYGQPARHASRMDILHWMSVWGMNTYVYGPKDDEKHRAQWRELYDEAQSSRFLELDKAADWRGISFVYGISPGKDIDPRNDDDFVDLTTKLESLYQLGVSDFALLMDDISADKNGDTGEDHAFLVGRLYDWLKALDESTTLLFVPTVYFGTLESISLDEREYLEALHDIDENISISWTGEGVFDPEITAAEIDYVAGLIGRQPWIWDNYPVNDYVLGQNMHLASIEGRDKSLLENIDGLLMNPMVEDKASLFALGSYAALFADPENYDPASAWQLGAAAIDGDFPFEHWQKLVKVFEPSEKLFPGRPEMPELNALIDEFLLAIDFYPPEDISFAAKELVTELYAYYSLASEIPEKVRDVEFKEEMDFRLRKLSAWSEASLIAVNLMTADVYGVRSDFALQEARLEELRETLAWGYNVADATFSRLMNDLDEKERASRFVGYRSFEPIVSKPLQSARVGQTYYFDLAYLVSPDCSWSVLADFDYEVDDKGLFSWTPEQTGKFSLLAMCERDNSLSAMPFEVEAVPSLNDLPKATLLPNAKIEEVGPVKVLMQNEVLYAERGFGSISHTAIVGPWSKRRMSLDHSLSFAERTPSIIDKMVWESNGAMMDDFDDSAWDKAAMPEAENLMPPPYHSSGPEEYWGGVWYRFEASVPKSAKDLRLVFQAASYILDVWVDGVYLGYHEGGYTPGYFPLPTELAAKQNVTIVARVDHPYWGSYPDMVAPSPDSDFWDFAGITQDVLWEYYPAGKEAAVSFVNFKTEGLTGKIMLDLVIDELSGKAFSGEVEVDLYSTDPLDPGYLGGFSVAGLAFEDASMGGDDSAELSLSSGERLGLHLEPRISKPKTWTPWQPNLYILEISIYDEEENLVDRYSTQMGFRELVINDDHIFQLNKHTVFLPGFVYNQDSAFSGIEADWSTIKNDLQWIGAYGGKLLRSGGRPAHYFTSILADRLGLAVMQDIPAFDLSDENLEAFERRPINLQAWREMIFASYNRPSIMFWGACTHCKSEKVNALRNYLKDLHDDLDDNYPDGRFITQVADPQDYLTGVNDSLSSVDVVGFSLYHGVDYNADSADVAADILDFVSMVNSDNPDKPLFIGAYGDRSNYDGSGYGRQVEQADYVWNGVEEYLSRNQDKAVRNEAGVISMCWNSMFDGYSNFEGSRTSGISGMDRFSHKPVAATLKEWHQAYQKDQVGGSSSGTGIVMNEDDSEDNCSQAHASSGMSLILLLTLAWFVRRRFC